MNTQPKVLTLAFSAIGERLESLLSMIDSINNIDSVEVVIVVQRWTKEQKDSERFASRNITWDDGVGLSRSRNIALSKVTGQYFWLLDDDVQIAAQDLSLLIDKLTNNVTADFFRIKIGCIEWRDKFFKNYKEVTRVSKLNLLQVSSIEIIGSTRFVAEASLRFNENIGLGTDYQGGEEIHFLIDAWEAGARFSFIDQVFVRHTCLFEQRVLATKNIFKIRGATASRYGVLGLALLLRWGWRYMVQYKKPSYIANMAIGFVQGYKKFK